MNSTASIPLTEALPWPSPAPPSDGRCFVVYDSVETDGRFLLYQLASQVLVDNGRVLWLACGPWTSQLIASALKKISADVASVSTDESDGPLHIRSVTIDLATRLEDPNAVFEEELYVKELYLFLCDWSSKKDGCSWIVIDDISALATLVGERLAYCFILSLRAHIKRSQNCSIIVRCSHDVDMEQMKERDTASVLPGSSARVDWVGAGGINCDDGRTGESRSAVPWERALAELADGIVNVEPLASGFSREAHGRLIICSRGRGWGTRTDTATRQTLQPLVMNYCCHDTFVSAIRLRGSNTTEI